MATKSNAADALREVDLFRRLSRRSLEKVADRVKTVQHPAGKDLAQQGEGGVAFHLLVSGTADVLVDGRVVRTLGPGDYFGELSLIDGGPRSATVRTTSDVVAHTIVAWQFTPLLDDEPEISKALLLTMCERLRSAESRSRSATGAPPGR